MKVKITISPKTRKHMNSRYSWKTRSRISNYQKFMKGEIYLLRLSVQKNEYIMVGDNVKITFLGGVKNQAHIMIEAPKEVNIARGRAIEKRAEQQSKDND